MAKKGKKKSEAFSGFKKVKKTLKAPMTAVFESSPVPMEKSSWNDVQMPEYLWVALVFSCFDEGESFQRLRRVAAKWPSHSKLDNPSVQPGSHSAIAALPKDERRKLLEVIASEISKEVLSPLCNLDNLPAAEEWSEFFSDEETLDDWFALGDAIQQCSQFQSQAATHICWFISLVGVASGQMTEPSEFDEMRRKYPENYETVGGLFRCTAGNNRIIETQWPEQFWTAVFRSRAEQGGTKDLYDSYYDYSSSILHGDWLGSATVGTTWDLNPFHRLQRVPRVHPRNFPSVVPDLFRLLNRLLDSLNKVYPGMDFRMPDLLKQEETIAEE